MVLTIEGIPTEIVRLFVDDAKKGLESGMVHKEKRFWNDVREEDRQAMRTKIHASIKDYHRRELGKYTVMGEETEEHGDGIYRICCSVYNSRYRSLYEYKVGHSLH